MALRRRRLVLTGFVACAGIGVIAAVLTRDVVGLTAGFSLGIAFILGVWYLDNRRAV